MKIRFLWLALLVAALLPLSARADGLLSNKFIVTGAGTSIDNIGTAIGFHKITWNVSGTASVCTVALDTSADGITWSAGAAIAGQTCTSNGSSTVATVVANYVRINMTALTVTAGSSVTVTWTGYVSSPSSGGGAVNCTTTGGVAYENGTANTLTCGANITYASGLILAAGPGGGSFTPGAWPAVMNFQQPSDAAAHQGWVITNAAADAASGFPGISAMSAGISDAGLGALCSGGRVGDGNNNYGCFVWNAFEGIVAQTAAGTSSQLITPFSVKAASAIQSADIFDILSSTDTVLAGFGNLGQLKVPNGIGSCTPPTVNGIYQYIYNVTASTAVAPTCPEVGLGGRSITGAATTDTVLAADNGTVVTHDKAASGTLAITLPTATTLTNSNFAYRYSNHSAQTDVITPTTWTIQVGTTAGAATLSVAPGASCLIKIDPNSATNWLADCGPGLTGANGLAASSYTSNGTTTFFTAYTQGSTSAAVAPCNNANTKCIQGGVALTANIETLAPATAQGIFAVVGNAAATTEMYSGDTGHSAVVTTGSATSIGSTSLCSTVNCPVGTYVVNTYIDITTACGTSGTYVVNLIYTDDQGAKTIPVNINGTGAVPATGVLTTTSTANFGESAQVIRSTGAASINYSTTAVACGTAGPMVGKLYLSVVPVQ